MQALNEPKTAKSEEIEVEFCVFKSIAPGLKLNFYEPYLDVPIRHKNFQFQSGRSATACVYECRPQPCDGEIRMRIVKKSVTADADLNGKLRMRIVKKFRDSACGLRSRRESNHRGEGGQARRRK